MLEKMKMNCWIFYHRHH